jgi:hypothetical protein
MGQPLLAPMPGPYAITEGLDNLQTTMYMRLYHVHDPPIEN